MGELLLCHEPIASLPYYVEGEGINLYSMEELCYYIAGNTYLLDRTFMNEDLCFWVEKQMKLYKLADRLRGIMNMGGSLSAFAEAIIRQTAYLEESEIQEVLQVLQTMEKKSEFECGKIRADRLMEQEKYFSAIYEYKRLLDSKAAKGENAQILGNLRHNLGTAYVRLFLFDEAADCYEHAYKLNQRGESLRECLMCFLLRQDEEGFLQKAKEYGIDEMGQKEIRNEVSLAANGDEMSALLSRLKVLEGKLEGQGKGEAKKALRDLIFQWKEAYRRSCK